MQRLLETGCDGYLIYEMKAVETEINVDGIRVVQDFPDIFPEEISGLPPNREVEFCIELLPWTEPISRAPYLMAPIELKELKEQLQKLL